MKQVLTNANIYSGVGEHFLGTLIQENGRISALYPGEIRPEDAEGTEPVDLKGATVIPGLIDVHTHGRAGYDFNTATSEELSLMARSYLDSGVTTLFPTLASAPFEELCAAADRIRAFRADAEGAVFAGVHLEGRYLNPEKRGAHAPELLAPLNPDELTPLLSHTGLPCHMTCAPECDLDGAFVKQAVACGMTVGIGHTSATYEEAMTALKRGAVSFTHTYNCMPPLHHRAGGAVAAAFLSDAYAELICDGMHVSSEMVQLAYRCKGNEKLVLITDSMQATGCPDGTYAIAGQPCVVENGRALTLDGHLAGSTLTLIDGLANLMRFCSLRLEEALPTATQNPARMVGIDSDTGTLEPGKYADYLIFRNGFPLSETRIKPDAVVSRGIPNCPLSRISSEERSEPLDCI